MREESRIWSLNARAASCQSCGLACRGPVPWGPAPTPLFSPLHLFILWQTTETLELCFVRIQNKWESVLSPKGGCPQPGSESGYAQRGERQCQDPECSVLSQIYICVSFLCIRTTSTMLEEIKCCVEHGCRWEKFLLTVCLTYHSKKGISLKTCLNFDPLFLLSYQQWMFGRMFWSALCNVFNVFLTCFSSAPASHLTPGTAENFCLFQECRNLDWLIFFFFYWKNNKE